MIRFCIKISNEKVELIWHTGDINQVLASIVAVDALVLKHQAISIYKAVKLYTFHYQWLLWKWIQY